MFDIVTLPNGNLQIIASEEGQDWLKGRTRGYWSAMSDIFEPWSTNGGYTHFDAGQANPFVGLTDAPCIAESMGIDDAYSVEGRLWYFAEHVYRDDLEELTELGSVIYKLAKD